MFNKDKLNLKQIFFLEWNLTIYGKIQDMTTLDTELILRQSEKNANYKKQRTKKNNSEWLLPLFKTIL